MQLKNLEKLEILEGNDMFPNILPHEKLLLDKTTKPRIGDVVLFKNRYGIKIPHRLIHCFMGYYFTRGDNCNYFNFPAYKKSILGVVVGKFKKIKQNKLMSICLDLFIIYYDLYRSLFDIKKKRHFLFLKLITKFFVPLESIFYPSPYNNHYLNKIVYGIIDQPKDIPIYYTRKAFDNKLSTNINFWLNKNPKDLNISRNQLKKILIKNYKNILEFIKNEKFSKNKYEITFPYKAIFSDDYYGRLKIFCINIYNSGVLTLFDLIKLRYLYSKIDIYKLAFKNIGIYELMGIPLIVLYLFDKRYNGGKEKDLATFVIKYYPIQIKKIKQYLQKRNYETPIYFLHLYKDCSPFKILKYLKSPKGYNFKKRKFKIFNIGIKFIMIFKNYCRIKYMLKDY